MQRFTVKTLANELQQLLESRYVAVLVEGEIHQLKPSRAGHLYLDLRDGDASLSAIVFGGSLRQIRHTPAEGQRVICRGKVGFYAPRGTVQLVVYDMQLAGEGALAKEIAARKARLMADGLLDPRRKRALPWMPRVVGVATSLHGQALLDFLRISRERFPGARILVAGCTVQGEEAPSSVIRAMDLLLEDGRAEVIVVTRGGGSRTDLHAFDDEMLCRHVAACPVPVVSAVGHEGDTSLCDLVADQVAPTPSGAAMLVLPDGATLARRVDEGLQALDRAVGRQIAHRRREVAHLQRRLRHPGDRLQRQRERLAALTERLAATLSRRIADDRRALARGEERLLPAVRRPIDRAARDLATWEPRLAPALAKLVQARKERLAALEARLQALSPLGVLGRGYAIVTDAKGKVVVGPEGVRYGDRLAIRLRDGAVDAIVS